MTAIPFAISSSPGTKAQEGAGRLINCFAVKNEQGARFPVKWTRCPGLRQLIELTGETHLRGAVLIDSTLIVVVDQKAYAVTESSGTYSATELGAISGTDVVTIAYNNASTKNIACVTAQGTKNLFKDSAPTDFADSNLPQANSVSELDGYLLWTIGDGRIFASDLNSVTVPSNSFTTEQSLGGLLRGVSYQGSFFAFGAYGTGVYTDAGLSPFPLQRQSFTIQRGIIGTNAIAGWEPHGPGFLAWVGDDGVVYHMDGYTPVPISSEDVGRVIGEAIRAGQGSSLEASAYTSGKNAFWAITNPGYWTWEYCISTGNWNERQSTGRLDWRSSRTVYAFNQWISGDRTTGKMMAIDPDYYKEADDPLTFILQSGVSAIFPNALHIPRAEFDITAAIGKAAGEDPIETDPTVLISWSNDGGYSFGNPVQRKIGKQGDSGRRVTVFGLGLSGPKGKVFRLAVSDPVHVAVMGGDIAADARAG